MKFVAAVDLGASSGRTMLGRVSSDTLEIEETTRFANEPVRVHGTLYWDVLSLWRGVLEGLGQVAARVERPDSIGIDSWAVDYGLTDASGALLGNPVHYRDGRTDGVMEQTLEQVPADRIYAVTGLQFLPFNTCYQLLSAAGTPQLSAARRLLMIPDLLAYWLTGQQSGEVTNASTTQLVDVRQRSWATDLMADLDIHSGLFLDLVEPGARIGHLLPEVMEHIGLGGEPVPVTAVGTHDTASAVVGVPADTPNFAYISCGTWSLAGVELDRPVLSQESREANYTNELGVDGTVRYHKNIMGLWLLQESQRTWEREGQDVAIDRLLDAAADVPAFTALIDPDHGDFLSPGDMPRRIAEYCRRVGDRVPEIVPETVRCILDSLALAHRRAVRTAAELSDREVDVVHIVGGGSHNELLCQLTADACGLPVVAGPSEATAVGNILVQARALGAVSGELADLRALLRSSQEFTRYAPAHDEQAWAAAERRVFDD